MDYRHVITLEPGKRGGKPCIRGLRITVYDVLECLASGIVTARYDQDGDALTKQPGDLTGQARVKVPAESIALARDTVLP